MVTTWYNIVTKSETEIKQIYSYFDFGNRCNSGISVAKSVKKKAMILNTHDFRSLIFSYTLQSVLCFTSTDKQKSLRLTTSCRAGLRAFNVCMTELAGVV